MASAGTEETQNVTVCFVMSEDVPQAAGFRAGGGAGITESGPISADRV